MRPQEIKLHRGSRTLELIYQDDQRLHLSCELLRVYSPSAEVRGHGPGQEVLQLDKEQVNINDVQPVGHYAIKLVFDDGHDSGIFDWKLLYELGQNQDNYWQDYLNRLAEVGHQRKAETT